MYIYFSTLGCKLNFTETSTLKRIAEEQGFCITTNVEKANVIVVNTCTVTQTADKKSRYTIRHLHKLNPKAKIIATGCYAEVEAETIQKIEGVSLVIGNQDKVKFSEFLTNTYSGANNITTFFKAYSLGDRTRSFLKVQDGCNYFCSYCKVPFARGRSRNAAIKEIVQQANEIVQHGVKEIVLTGINIGDFGQSTNETFIDLLMSLEKETECERYRISSVEPNLLTEEIIDFVLSSNRFVPHFHIPLQSGSNELLKLMNRRYSTDLFVQRVEYIKKRNPLAAIGVDVIVGFPGETEQHFNQTFNLIQQLDISYLHVFEYSERKGTKASLFQGKVQEKIKKERSLLLRKLSAEKYQQFALCNLQTTQEVLIEKRQKGTEMIGYTKNYLLVALPFEKEKLNTVVLVRLLNWEPSTETIKGMIV